MIDLHEEWFDGLVQEQHRMLLSGANPHGMIADYQTCIAGLERFIKDQEEGERERTGAGIYHRDATGQHGLQRSGKGGSP